MPDYRGADGASLHYDERDRSDGGSPLVVLAGGAARHPAYLGDLAGLDRRHRLIVPHLRGVGASPAPPRPETGSYWAQACDIDALRAQLGLDTVRVLAHSAGTRLAMAYAAQFPAGPAALVLVTPPAGHLVDVPDDIPELIAARRGDPDFETALATWAAGPPTAPTDLVEWQRQTGPFGYAGWGPAQRAHNEVGRVDFAANRAYFSVEPPAGWVTGLSAVTAPVLVVAGGGDCVTGVAPVLAVAGLFRNGRAATVDGSGHYPWVEQPARFRAVVDEFLQAPPSPVA